MTFVKTFARSNCMWAALALLLVAAGCSDRDPEWAARNQQVIDKAKGVSATLGGRGALLERLDMQPGSVYPEQTLGEELIVIGHEGGRDRRVRWRDGGAHQGQRADNTWAQPGENFVWACDVAADGSLSNKRQFAMLSLTPEVLGAAKPVDRFDSGADGTAVDTDGRLYVATRTGVQMFLPDGTPAGTIALPQPPISLTFGGPGSDVLYIVGGRRPGRFRPRSEDFAIQAGWTDNGMLGPQG